MKLHDSLPRGVTVNGRFYRMDFDFRNVLRMMRVMERKDMMLEAWLHCALKCVMRRPRGDTRAIFAEVQRTLFPKAKKAEGEKLMDFDQDADMIRAAFRQAYGIDLYREKLHWLEFSALLSSLPQGTHYTDVLEIRARPMPEATKYNAKEREQLMKAKAAYAVHMTEEERKDSYNRGLNAMARSMLSLARERGGNDE